jgi:predicted TIM-barrel fold metal-dependent hydrolase
MSLSFKSHIPVFDANIGVGHRHNRRYPYDTPERLLEEMARHGVDRALVYAVQGELISPTQGNDQLAQWTDKQASLIPQYVAGNDPGSIVQLEELHTAGKLTSVRLHNTVECKVPFTQWLYGDLLEWVSAHRIPIWISLADTPPTEIVDTFRHYPGLTVVLLGAHYVHATMVRPILKALPNATLELSRYENLCGIEKLVEEIGARRLMYGSFFPRYAMGPVLFALHRATISEDDLEAICSRNLESILES